MTRSEAIEMLEEQESKLDLISRAEAIEAIEIVDWYHQNSNKDMVHGANDDEHQAWYKADDVYKALEDVPSADRPRGEWIPVSEKLPEEKEMVLTYDNIGHIDFGQYDKRQWYWLAEACADYWAKNDGVIAWMPLPEPYKGGENE